MTDEGRDVRIPTPRWFLPHLEPARYHAIYSGRGAGKSTEVAETQIDDNFRNRSRRLLCIREVQKSLDSSVKEDLEAAIAKFALGGSFIIHNNAIKSAGGDGLISFVGMNNQTADSIKSFSGYDCAWVEEAQSFSLHSLRVLLPTIRRPGSEIWFTWNPRFPDDPVDDFFRCNSDEAKERGQKPPENAIITRTSYEENPWFGEPLISEMTACRERSTEEWLHVWCGEYESTSEARVFRNWKVQEFDTPKDAIFYFGADWGFGDATALVRCFIVGRTLYVDYEAAQERCEIDDIPALFLTIPEAEKWTICADSHRPDTISYVRRQGFKILPAVKGPDSVEDGIEFLKSYSIVVHPRCKVLINELARFSYQINPKTQKVIPKLDEKTFHPNVIPSLRYATEAVRRLAAKKKPPPAPPPGSALPFYSGGRR